MRRRPASLIAAAILSACALAAPAQARPRVPFWLLGHGPAARASTSVGRRAEPATGLEARSLSAGVLGGRDQLTTQAATIGLLPSVPVGSGPQEAAFDPATDTVYVANQNDNTVSVVDARHCHAGDTGGCAQTPATVATGAGPFSIAIDHATRTVYVANQSDNTVSVINGATCNGHNSSGCAQPTKTVAAGPTPFGIAVDPATSTVYVADSGGAGNTVSIIDGRSCNATVTTGCGQQPATVTVGQFPFEVLVDRQNSTVYVTNAADGTVSMLDERTCNAANTAGCNRTPPTVAVPNFPLPLALDQRTGTLYVGSQNDPIVAVINAKTCNALNTAGCGGAHPRLKIAGGTDGMSIDEKTATLFVANNGPGTSPARERSVSVLNTATCNATTTTGCDQNAPTALTGANPGGNTTDPSTNTEYVTTFDNTLQVINGATCNATDVTGCGQPSPATQAGVNPISMAINPATSSVYVGDAGEFAMLPWTISVLNAATCNTVDSTGCLATPTSFTRPALPQALTVDQATNTLYSSDASLDLTGNLGDTISAINGATCDATVSTGCGATPPAVTVPPGPTGTAEDVATHTLYVANGNDPTVSVINVSTCNAGDTSGCGQTPPQIPLGAFPLWVAVNQATDTIYVLNPGTPGTVSVIDGRSCNATNTSGCGNVPPTVTVGNDAIGLAGLAVDQATNTVYVINQANNTVSVINGATCDASHTSGCGQTPATVPVGRQKFGFVAVDQSTNLVYVTNNLDDTVSVIDGNTCNGTDSSGCRRTPPTVPAGANPSAIVVNPTDGTVYVADVGGGTATFFRFVVPDRPVDVTAVARHGTATLAWGRTYDGGLPIVYHVIPSPSCPDCTGVTTPSTSGMPATTVSGLDRGRAYTFKIEATNAAGTGPVSAPSNPVTP